jgi:20S proteasome subunit alpha 2
VSFVDSNRLKIILTSGKLVQIEYALQAVNAGVTSLGIKASNGIVLATERKSSSHLINSDSLSKIGLITPDIGMVYSGMGPDFRVLLDTARKSSHVEYKRIYNEYPPTRILVQEIASTVQKATQSGGVRPYGVSLLVAGYDESHGYGLYQIDPSGSYFPWKATAIGKGNTSAKTFLEKRWSEELELEDAIHIALLTLKESIEGEMNGDTVEIAVIGVPNDSLLGFEGQEGAQGPRFRKLSPQEIEDRLDAL